MLAGYAFAQHLAPILAKVERIQVELYGSLSLTGRGHHTDRASILGLMGNKPDSIDISNANQMMATSLANKVLPVLGEQPINFDPDEDVIFHTDNLPLHENGMTISAFDEQGQLLKQETYYSTGGGFIVTAKELEQKDSGPVVSVEYPFKSADELLKMADNNGLSLGGLVLRNERAFYTDEAITARAEKIWQVMSACIEKGFATEGILEGGLNVTRRAPALLKRLRANAAIENDPLEVMDWVNVYAFAVSEENAAGGQVVTSPTNGAAGVIPAVLMYYHEFIHELDTEQLRDFLAVSGAIGMLYKMNASISGAEVGCQGEIGVSSSMAAAGLTALRGGTNEQCCIAAEIAMEHSLGMTCDPIGGLVQVPCIERNAMGAIKAINASRMALKRNSKCLISLDKVIETMYQTGKDMNKKYRETSLGGLAVIHIAPPCE